MTEWFYLAAGFALFSLLIRQPGTERRGGSSWTFYLELFFALCVLTAIDSLSVFFLWGPAGRMDLRPFSVFLWALLVDEGRARWSRNREGGARIRLAARPFYFFLVGYSLWSLGEEGRRFHALLLPVGTGALEFLLRGLERRLEVANPPKVLEGSPLLFWEAAVLCLIFQGLVSGL